MRGERGGSMQALPPMQEKRTVTQSPSASTVLSLRSAPFRTTRSSLVAEETVVARWRLSWRTVADGVARCTCVKLDARRTLMCEAEVICEAVI